MLKTVVLFRAKGVNSPCDCHAGWGHQAAVREDKILRFLVEGTVSETGSEFFRALARNLSEALQTFGAWVPSTYPRLVVYEPPAFWLNDRFLEHYEHAIDGTPCETVIDAKSRAHFPERLLEFFPNHPDLAALGAVRWDKTPVPAEAAISRYLTMVRDTTPYFFAA